MFRLSQREERSRTTVTIDGQMAGEYLQVVETCCETALSAGKPVHLFLREVTHVDQAAKLLLRRLMAKQVKLHGNGVYTKYLVDALNSAAGQSKSEL